jgi:hypothetical protein
MASFDAGWINSGGLKLAHVQKHIGTARIAPNKAVARLWLALHANGDASA